MNTSIKTLERGQVVYHVVECYDGIYRCFEMMISSSTGVYRGDEVFDIYLKGKRCDGYCNFSDIGIELFLTKDDAINKISELSEQGFKVDKEIQYEL